jgi:hypothetical protein
MIEEMAEAHKHYGEVPFCNTSVDLWTSKHQNYGYAALDLSFTNPDGIPRFYTAAVGYLPGSHDHQHLCEWVKKVCTLLGFAAGPASLFLLATVDGGKNIMKAFRVMGVPILYCTAHRLHLCISTALGSYPSSKPREPAKGVHELMAKMRRHIGHFTMSPQNTSSLTDLQASSNVGKDKGKKRVPLQDVCTRWTSSFRAILRTTFLRMAYLSWFASHDPRGKFKNQLDQMDYHHLRLIAGILQPFNKIITLIQSRFKSTISIAYLYVVANATACTYPTMVPNLADVEGDFEKLSEEDDKSSRAAECGKVLQAEVAKRFPVSSLPMAQKIAMALDPRTKGLPGLPAKDREAVWVAISKEVQKVREYKQKQPEANKANEEDKDDGSMNMDSAMLALMNFMEQAPQDEVRMPETEVGGEKVDTEVALWKDTVPVHSMMDHEFDVLDFWISNRGKPWAQFLYVVAFKYFGCQPTSAENERTFSHCGRLLGPLRTLMAPSLVEDVIFIMRNVSVLEKFKMNGQTVERVVDVELIMQKYIEVFGRKKKEKDRRKKQQEGTEQRSKTSGQRGEGAEVEEVEYEEVEIEVMCTPDHTDDEVEEPQQPAEDSTTKEQHQPLITELLARHKVLQQEAIEHENRLTTEEKMNALYTSLAQEMEMAEQPDAASLGGKDSLDELFDIEMLESFNEQLLQDPSTSS